MLPKGTSRAPSPIAVPIVQHERILNETTGRTDCVGLAGRDLQNRDSPWYCLRFRAVIKTYHQYLGIHIHCQYQPLLECARSSPFFDRRTPERQLLFQDIQSSHHLWRYQCAKMLLISIWVRILIAYASLCYATLRKVVRSGRQMRRTAGLGLHGKKEV